MPDGYACIPNIWLRPIGSPRISANPNLDLPDGTVHLSPHPNTTSLVKSGREDFEKGHVPGAQFLDLQADLSDNGALPLRFMLPKPADFAAAMRRFGVSDDSRIVTYSTANPQWATRVWWVLRVYGFDNAAVLNGGFQKWVKERPRGRDRRREGGAPGGEFHRAPGEAALMADKHDVLKADRRRCGMHDQRAPGRAARRQRRQHLWSPGPHRGQRQRPDRGASSMRRPIPSCRRPSCARSSTRFMPSTRRSSPIAAAASPPAPRRMPSSCSDTPTCGSYDASMSEWAIDDSLPMETRLNPHPDRVGGAACDPPLSRMPEREGPAPKAWGRVRLYRRTR